MSWAAEMGGLVEAAQTFADRVLWLDFERLLAGPGVELSAALTRLHGVADLSDVELMLTSPLFGRYSKGLEHAYDADLRRQVLAGATREHAAEIGKGRAWLASAERISAVVRQAVACVASL
jgi:hypothetical protein